MTRFALEVVPPLHIPQVWPWIWHWMEACCARGNGDMSVDWLHNECASGAAQLLVILDDEKVVHGAVVVQMQEQADSQRTCVILACGGEGAKQWLHLIRDVERDARDSGATSMKFMGRFGWSRLLPPDYRMVQAVYVKDLRH